MALTEAGQRLLPRLDEVVTQLQTLRSGDEHPVRVLSVAAPSFMNDAFLATIAEATAGPARARPRSAAGGAGSARLRLGELLRRDLPRSDRRACPATWTSMLVGACWSALFALPALGAHSRQAAALAKSLQARCRSSRLVFNVNGKFVRRRSTTPARLPFGARTAGPTEAQTFGLAAGALPARPGRSSSVPPSPRMPPPLHRKNLVTEVKVRGWDVREAIYLSCNIDRMLARMQAPMVRALKARLVELEEGRGDLVAIKCLPSKRGPVAQW